MDSEPYIHIPKMSIRAGKSVTDGEKVMKRLRGIDVELREILERRGSPLWVPRAGEIGYRSWREYQRSNFAQIPYPGTSLAQPDWFESDNAGFYDLEHWCYLKHEQVALMQAIGKQIPEQDRGWQS